MKLAIIVPTGDEIKSGVVLDTDSPEILQQLIRRFPNIQALRMPPLVDDEAHIEDQLHSILKHSPDLVVFVGGSGGGHRFSPSLGRDFTQSALEKQLEIKAVREIYGKNGHLWCKLLCGKKDGAIIINVPGPYTEAKAAMEAFLRCYTPEADLNRINEAMAQAMLDQYPPQTAMIQGESEISFNHGRAV